MPAAAPTPVRSHRLSARTRRPDASAVMDGTYLDQALVRRPALVERLADADATVAALIAPPGYGKTSLLREWSERDERPFVWLNVATLRSPKAVRTLPPAVLTPAALTRGLVIVVDDAHLAKPEILSELIDTVLPELPDHSTLALASRADPALPLGRLRAHRQLLELRDGDLALATADVERVLHDEGVELEPDAVEVIAYRTEGWAAGVYLAALSLRGCDDAGEDAARFGGSDHLVAEYLRDEVLAGVAPATLTFMVRSSVLTELSGPACDAVLERDGSAQVLGGLARTNLFLRATDAAHERFRWHPMFREALQAELRRTEPELIPRLNGRASAWLHSRGDVTGAIDHAVAGGDVTRAGDLLIRNVVAYVGGGQAPAVAGWLAAFPDQQICTNRHLALVAALTALAQGDANQAQSWRLAAGEANAAAAAADAGSMQAGIALVEAMSPRAGVAMIDGCSRAAYEVDGEGGQWRPIACLLRGVALHLSGDHEAAVEFLEEGIQAGRDRAPAIAALCRAQRATIAIESRDWDTATELTDRAVGELERHGLSGEPMCALVFASAAAARGRAGRSDEAKRDLRRGMDLLTELGDFVPWYGAEARILLAHASLGLADVLRARTLLAEASRFARRCPEVLLFRQWFDDAWAHIDTLAETSLSGPSSLTIAELRILRFLPSHRSFKEIAGQLGVSANTVKTQAHAVYRKLGAASRSEAVTRASQAGLLGS